MIEPVVAMEDRAAPVADARRRALVFAVGALGVLGAIGAWLALRRHHVTAGTTVATLGASLVPLALAVPRAVLALRALWMGVARRIGEINARIILSLIFVLLVTPLGLVRRALGKDPLDLRAFRRPGAPGPWHDHPPSTRDHFDHPW